MASSQSSSSTTQAQPCCCQCALASVNVASFVSAKLRRDKNSNNYKSWKEQMLCLIDSQDLLGYIAGEISPPPMTSEAYAVWRRRDRLVKGWILGALSDEVVETAVNLNSARDVWLHLEKAFVKPRGPPPQAAAEQEKDWNEYLPLYIAALRGDWVTAKEILDQDPNAVKARVSFTSETALHIAVGTGKSIPFVEKLVDMMPVLEIYRTYIRIPKNQHA